MLDNETQTTLNNVLLYITGNINGTDEVASFCTIYQFLVIFDRKLVSQSTR